MTFFFPGPGMIVQNFIPQRSGSGEVQVQLAVQTVTPEKATGTPIRANRKFFMSWLATILGV